MFNFLNHITARTKILFVAFILILMPGAIISYLSLQSIRQKAENLKTKYNGTVTLIRDKLENEVSGLETNLRNSAIEQLPEASDASILKLWLNKIESEYPAFTNLILVNSEGGLISSSVFKRWHKPEGSGLLMNRKTAAVFDQAEKAEFINKNLSEAIIHYRKALEASQSQQERVLLLSRLGRCHLKLGEFREAVEEYERILGQPGKPDKEVTIGTVPARVVALSQIAECWGALGDNEKQYNASLDLFKNLVDNPWDLSNNEFSYYLNSVSKEIEDPNVATNQNDSLKSKTEDFQKRKELLLKQMRLADFIDNEIVPEIITYISKGSQSEIRPVYISKGVSDSALQFGFFRLTVPSRQSESLVLVYQFEKEYLRSALFPEVLSSIELGKDVLVGILDKNDNALFIQNNLPLSTPMVSTGFSPHFADWKVALFDPEGKSIEKLTGQEKRLYLMLFIGIITVMLIGIILMVRTVMHESEVSRMKSEFVSNVSHELKTPLALIRMFGETLDSGIVTDEKDRRKFYGIIRKESERLTHLINNVLDFSRMDAGVKEYNFLKEDITEVIRNTLEAYKFQISESGFRIESDLPDESIILKIDKEAIAQVLLNLLNNAVKYSDEEKYIMVNVSKESASALISVIDHGVGIPKDELKKIFDKFYRISNARSRETRGSGLGLTLARNIVAAHGGTIEVESYVGKGSRFTVRIPLFGL